MNHFYMNIPDITWGILRILKNDFLSAIQCDEASYLSSDNPITDIYHFPPVPSRYLRGAV